MDPTIPESWQAPDWHPDWGDVAAELDLLRRFAIEFRRVLPACPLALQIPEPGLMYVEVSPSNASPIEVLKPGGVAAASDVIGIFSGAGSPEIEVYADNVPDAVAIVARLAQGEP